MSTRLDDLRTHRDRLAEWLDQPAADRASLSRELRATLAEIEALEAAQPTKKGTALDEVTARRAAKSAKASGRAEGRRV